MNKRKFDKFIQHSKRIQNNEVHIRIIRDGDLRKFYWVKQEVIFIEEHKRENAYNQNEINKLVKKIKRLEKDVGVNE